MRFGDVTGALGVGYALMDLVRPALPFLASYSAALRTGWSSNDARNVAAEELQLIAHYANAEGVLYRIFL